MYIEICLSKLEDYFKYIYIYTFTIFGNLNEYILPEPNMNLQKYVSNTTCFTLQIVKENI